MTEDALRVMDWLNEKQFILHCDHGVEIFTKRRTLEIVRIYLDLVVDEGTKE